MHFPVLRFPLSDFSIKLDTAEFSAPALSAHRTPLDSLDKALSTLAVAVFGDRRQLYTLHCIVAKSHSRRNR